MAGRVISVMLLIVAAIHLVPLVGVLGASRINGLYEVQIASPNLEILMRHRAVVFGLLSLLFAYAAFKPSVQPIALLIAAVSTFSFVALAWSVGEYNSAVRNVVSADWLALGCVAIAAGLYYYERR
ncbi:MAG: phosphopantetheine adenylyltransferase [Pseudomonadota bacterium]